MCNQFTYNSPVTNYTDTLVRTDPQSFSYSY